MESGERSEEEEETQSSGAGEDAVLETPLRPAAEGEGRNGEKGEEGEGSGSEEGETSDSASSNSSSTTTGSSSSSGVASRSPGGVEPDGGALMQTDEYGDHFHVNCAGNAAKFYLNRFARGSIGRCVLFRSRWITPNEFQAISGRQSSKDWKRSIRLRGRCLKEYITQGLFQEHLKTCACQICSGEAAEHLRQEGEMALAAKRRRLSQADGGGSMATGGHSSILSEVLTRDSTHSPTHLTGRVGTKIKRRRGRGGKVHRVWSPSGEMAHELSDDEEEGEGGEGEGEEDSKDQLHQPSTSAAVDTSLEFRRRSRRSAHRKHTGYRTELGTFNRPPREWDLDEVSEFLSLQGFGAYTQHFQEGEVDGESMFLLKEHHLVERFGLKLGPTLKLLDTISRLRHPPA